MEIRVVSTLTWARILKLSASKVRNWEVLLYQRFTGKLTGKNFLPVKIGEMQFFSKYELKLDGNCGREVAACPSRAHFRLIMLLRW